jgi:hypothetical protein
MTPKKRGVDRFMKEWLEVHVQPKKAALTYRAYEQTTRMCRPYGEPDPGRISRVRQRTGAPHGLDHAGLSFPH